MNKRDDKSSTLDTKIKSARFGEYDDFDKRPGTGRKDLYAVRTAADLLARARLQRVLRLVVLPSVDASSYTQRLSVLAQRSNSPRYIAPSAQLFTHTPQRCVLTHWR